MKYRVNAIRSKHLVDSKEEQMTDEIWQAIVNNDINFDDQFFYAIKTTGIFCRPSCKSRVPIKENVRIYKTALQALSANFRPCKRCKPTEERLPEYEWVDLITKYIENNYKELLTLQTLADMCHGSPYHLQRTFKRIKGVTPTQYVQNIRIQKAKQYLLKSDIQIEAIAMKVGMSNTSYFITLFKKMTGCTPSEYRRLQRNRSKVEVIPNKSK